MNKLAAGSAEQDVLARLKKAEADLTALRRELDHSHQLATLGELTAGIAHEINNILTPVLAYAQLARSNPSDSKLAAKAIRRTIAGVESASRIAEAVLGFARNEDRTDQSNIREVLDASLACLGRDPTRDGINLLIDVPRDAEVAIRPLALQQVMLNLILNALNALHGKPGELRISAVSEPGGKTRITVADNGPGVSAEVAQTLFDPFVSGHKGDDTPASGHGGSGLGLSICKRLIEGSNGSIALEDTNGHGAEFTIFLPTPSDDDISRENAA